jgi:nucleotide-binding universal stress UspA family protein
VDPLGDEDKGLSRTILDLAFSIEPEAEVHIAHAWRLLGESLMRSGRVRVPRAQLEQLLEEQERRHADALTELLRRYDITISDHHVHFEESEATLLIDRLAKQLPADLVVTGSVGRTGIPGFFIGNTAESLMQVLNLPVLTVKPAKFVSPVTLP